MRPTPGWTSSPAATEQPQRLAAMGLATRAVEVLARIPPARTRAVTVRRDIEIAMADGITLLADRYRAREDGTEPIILMRSPYGRTGVWALGARVFAERGYQIILQSCRGTGGSGGEFNAYRNERSDGLATLAWIERQPWFSGKIAMFGPSYLGIAQWAIATDPPWPCPSPRPGCAGSPTRAARSHWRARCRGWRCSLDRAAVFATGSRRPSGWGEDLRRYRCAMRTWRSPGSACPSIRTGSRERTTMPSGVLSSSNAVSTR